MTPGNARSGLLFGCLAILNRVHPLRGTSTNAAIQRVPALKTDGADVVHIEAKTDERTVWAKVKRDVKVLEVIEWVDLIETEQL